MTQRSPALPLKSCTSIDFGQIPSARGVEACTSTPLFPPCGPCRPSPLQRQHVVAELLVRLDVPGRLAGALSRPSATLQVLAGSAPCLVEHRRPAREVLAVEERNRLLLRRGAKREHAEHGGDVEVCLMEVSSKSSG